MGSRWDFQWALAPALRRVNRVRVTVSEDAVRAEVDGVGHRYPVTLPVTLALASRLVRQGAPLCVRTSRPWGGEQLKAQAHAAEDPGSSERVAGPTFGRKTPYAEGRP